MTALPLENKIVLTEQELLNIKRTVGSAISYVEAANYDERVRQARLAVERSFRTKEYVDPEKIG